MKKIKDDLYYFFVTRNRNISNEYERFVAEHLAEHNSRRLKHWYTLARLNWHYRILKRNDKLLYTKNTAKAVRLPYLKGAESELTNMPSPIHFIKPLLNYDIISFDIFDTLIFRPFISPKDLFMIVGEKLDFLNFFDIRIKAEQKAREQAYAETNSREVTIYDIYQVLEKETGIPANLGIQAEFETELELCFKNPYMHQVFYLLMAQKKKIIIISDMYYPQNMLAELLKKCGYEGYERLFSSCDYRTGKGNGGLFKIVRQIYGDDKTYCHIGDNYKSDIVSAKKNGFDAQHYPNVNDVGNPYRASYDGMSGLIGSAYGGIINSHLHNGLHKYSTGYELGFIYGGLYVLGYCKWIYEYAKTNHIDKVLFLARDGAIYSQVFNKYFNDVPFTYLYWSRLPSIRIEAERNRYDFLLRYIRHRLNDIHPFKISSILDMMSLNFLSDKLADYKLYPDACLTSDTITSMEHLLIDHWPEILQTYENEVSAAEVYLKEVIGDAKKIAVIDIGWAGSGPRTIKWLVEKKMNLDCNVSCLLAAGNAFQPSSNLPQVMNGELSCYIFNEMYNRNLKDFHVKTNSKSNNLFFELFTQAPSPTTDSFSENDGELGIKFGFVEIENYELMKEIHRGILDFSDLYYQTFKNQAFMLNISGYDAYIPFRFLVKDLSLIHIVFDSFMITRNLGYDKDTYKLETLGSILRAKGL